MNILRDEIRKQALAMPTEARLDLAYDLLASLPPTPVGSERSDEEWLAELQRRAEAAHAGAPGLAWEDVRKSLESRYASRDR